MKFKIKIKPRIIDCVSVDGTTFSFVYNEALDRPLDRPMPRIGVPSGLTEGDIIMLDDGKTYYVCEVIRNTPITEEVIVSTISCERMAYKKLEPGTAYRKVSSTVSN